MIEPRVAHGRSRAADGVAVQAERAREPHLAQHERAGEGPHPQGRRPRGSAHASGSAHRREVLVRRSKFRLGKIEHRLEVLGGYLIAYLNLDKVIKIIRTEDEPKPVLIKTFKLTDVQADAILNMRLRNLRKLEEMEIRKEDKDLRAERKELKKLLGSEKEQWKTVADEIKKVREKFGPKTAARQAPHDLREAPAARRGGDRGGDGRARADHRRGLGEGLDPRAARHRHRFLRHRLQDRRQPQIRVPGRDHVEVPGVRHQRPLLHARRRQASGRPRPRRADPPVRRHRAGRRRGDRVPLSGRPQVPGRQRAGQGLRRGRGRMSRQHPQGQAGAQRQAARRRVRHDGGRGRTRSPRSARTASWSSSRSTRCRR